MENKSEVKAEEKPEAKPEVKPEVKAEVKPEVKAEEKKEEAKQEVKEEEKKKKEHKKKEKKPEKKVEVVPDMAQLDLRVGKIMKVIKHPESTKLYLEEIDMGNGEIRKVGSGLQEHVPIEQMQDRLVVLFYNLKEKKIGGYPSYGMVLCASSADEKSYEPLLPPEGSVAGDKVFVEGFERKPVPDINLSKKNNPWFKVQPALTTSADLTVTYEGKPLKTEKGLIKVKSLVGARIS